MENEEKTIIIPKHKKMLGKLPQKLVVLPNPDKTFHEKWYPGRGILNFPHPYRGVLLGPPNRGKTTVTKNIIMHADPPFERVICIHCDPEYSTEYSDIDAEMLGTIPSPDEWDGECKTLCVLEDLEFKKLSKDQYKALSRLFGYVSTHKNVSCLLASQDPFEVPPIVRRCANLWVIWKMDDLQATYNCTKKAGLKKSSLDFIFGKILKKENDSLWIDKTKGTKHRLRLNGFQPIVEE